MHEYSSVIFRVGGANGLVDRARLAFIFPVSVLYAKLLELAVVLCRVQRHESDIDLFI